MCALNQGLVSSWALFWGVSVQKICAKASWASPHTFARFYKLDVTAPLLAHSVWTLGGCGVLGPSNFFHTIPESVAVTSLEDSPSFSFR